MSARISDYRGTVIPADNPAMLPWRNLLRTLATRFPPGTRVRHVEGRTGTVVRDHAAHVPGAHLGEASTVCLSGDLLSSLAEAMVFVSWDNGSEITWRMWVPATSVTLAGESTANRPSNTATVGSSR
ncbi:hypothetical protein ACIQU5_28135 [Streptomyces sp. NPDC090306]|uniref:hypothetical protein n=1 Tax=Streptomyces sp. NPDC090306 TaxID=3365961 RepID=UPI0037F4CB51